MGEGTHPTNPRKPCLRLQLAARAFASSREALCQRAAAQRPLVRKPALSDLLQASFRTHLDPRYRQRRDPKEVQSETRSSPNLGRLNRPTHPALTPRPSTTLWTPPSRGFPEVCALRSPCLCGLINPTRNKSASRAGSGPARRCRCSLRCPGPGTWCPRASSRDPSDSL